MKGNKNKEKNQEETKFYQTLELFCYDLEQRYVVTAFLATGILFNYMQRSCFYIALVDMTRRRRVGLGDYTVNESSWERCPLIFLESLGQPEGELEDWSDYAQGQLLASFFVGYVMTGIVGGYIADKFGAKEVFGASVVLTSVCSILTPLFAVKELGHYFVAIVRGVMGFVQGPMFPAATSMLTRWSPLHERAIMSAIANSAVPFSMFFGNILAGVIITNLTWHWVFYIFSISGFLWFILWQLFVFSNPLSHKFIKSTEMDFIQLSLRRDLPPPSGEAPLMEILTSSKFLVVALACFGFDWGFYIVSMELPFYLRNVLNLPMIKITVVSSMPWLSMWVGALVFGFLSHFLINQGVMRKIDMRKILAIVSTIVPGVLMILASWASCSHVLVSLLFSQSMFYAGTVYSGIRLSVVDLSPNFSGITMSLVNTSGSIAGFAVPLIVHTMIRDKGGTLMEWRISFCIAATFMILFSIPYIFFASASVQPWNRGSVVRKPVRHVPAFSRQQPQPNQPEPSTSEHRESEDDDSVLQELPFRGGQSF